MKTVTTLAFAGLAVAMLGGCQIAVPGPYFAYDTTRYTIENTEKFMVMDRPTQGAVTCTGLQEQVNSDGRLQVVANIKNRENRRIRVQVRCAFKDHEGYSTGDDSPWQTLVLGENATEAVSFAAVSNHAEKYTIAVRQAR